jgi:hypothetical protein
VRWRCAGPRCCTASSVRCRCCCVDMCEHVPLLPPRACHWTTGVQAWTLLCACRGWVCGRGPPHPVSGGWTSKPMSGSRCRTPSATSQAARTAHGHSGAQAASSTIGPLTVLTAMKRVAGSEGMPSLCAACCSRLISAHADASATLTSLLVHCDCENRAARSLSRLLAHTCWSTMLQVLGQYPPP